MAINAGETSKRILKFLKRNPLNLRIQVDPDSSTTPQGEVQSKPTGLVLDRRGSIAVRVVGEQPWDGPDIGEQIMGDR